MDPGSSFRRHAVKLFKEFLLPLFRNPKAGISHIGNEVLILDFMGDGHGPWTDVEWIPCRDGKSRPVEPVDEPVVDGTAGGVGLVRAAKSPLVDGGVFKPGSGSPFEGQSRANMLRGYGNAIVADVAAVFIRAFLDALDDVGAAGAPDGPPDLPAPAALG